VFQEPLLAVAPCGEGVLLARPGRGQRRRIAAFKDFGRAVVRGDDIHERTRPGAFNPAWPAAGRNQVIPVISGLGSNGNDEIAILWELAIMRHDLDPLAFCMGEQHAVKRIAMEQLKRIRFCGIFRS